MGYRISYHPEKDNRFLAKSSESKRVSCKIILCSLLIILIGIIIGTTRNEVMDFLIPGDLEQISQSSSRMIEDLKNGTSLGDAIATFCREIIMDGMQEV